MGLFGRKSDDDNIQEALDRCRERERERENDRAREALKRERNSED